MSVAATRLVFFVAGLALLLAAEAAWRHHPPVVPAARRRVLNLALGASGGWMTSLMLTAGVTAAAAAAWPWNAGILQALEPWPAARLLVEVAILDFVAWSLHLAYHRCGPLWRLHRVHHADLDLDVTSASRFHPGEIAVSAGAKLAVVLLLGVSPAGLVAFEVAMLAAAQFQHANVRLPSPVEAALWTVLAPPAMHRVHHHPDPAATHSNYGTLTSVWDRLFGTLRTGAPSDRVFGLPDLPRAGDLGFVDLLRLPFVHRGQGQGAARRRGRNRPGT